MKIHRVVQMLGATTDSGKLASDMYDLNYKTYHSKAEDKHIPISHMDFQHMVRAFVKQNDEAERCMKERNFLQEENENLEKQLGSQEQEDKNLELTSKIENLEGIIAEKEEAIDRLIKNETMWRDRYLNEVSYEGDRYTFSEIPNDASGRALVAQLREYLNTDSYKMRVRGQYLIDGENWRRYSYGQPIDKSKCLRVYVDKK